MRVHFLAVIIVIIVIDEAEKRVSANSRKIYGQSLANYNNYNNYRLKMDTQFWTFKVYYIYI